MPDSTSADLLSAAVVFRSWCNTAQSAPYRHATIPTNSAQDFLDSPARRRHRTAALSIGCWSLDWRDNEAEDPTFDDFIKMFQGLTSLELGWVEPMPACVNWGFLRSPSLSGMLSLLTCLSKLAYLDTRTKTLYRCVAHPTTTTRPTLLPPSPSGAVPSPSTSTRTQTPFSSFLKQKSHEFGSASQSQTSMTTLSRPHSSKRWDLACGTYTSRRGAKIPDFSDLQNVEVLKIGVEEPTVEAQHSHCVALTSDRVVGVALNSIPSSPATLPHLSLGSEKMSYALAQALRYPGWSRSGSFT